MPVTPPTPDEIMSEYKLGPAQLLRMAKTVERGVTSLEDIEGEVLTKVLDLAQHKAGLGQAAAARSRPKPAAKPAASANSKPSTKTTTGGKNMGRSTSRGRSEVGGSDIHDFKKDGRILFGEYVSEREIGTRWKTDANPEGLKPVYKIKTPAGALVEFWGAGVLSNRMAAIAPGTLIEIQFTGRKINVGGGSAWLFRVFDLEGEYPSDEEMAEAMTEAGAAARIAEDDAAAA